VASIFTSGSAVGATAHAAKPNDTHNPMAMGKGAAIARNRALTNIRKTGILLKTKRVRIFTV
jgi:hypothetical protein